MIGRKSDMVGRLVDQDGTSDFFSTRRKGKFQNSFKNPKKSLKNPTKSLKRSQEIPKYRENFLKLRPNFVGPPSAESELNLNEYLQ